MDEPRTHIFSPFDEALNGLRNKVLEMASLTERSLENAVKGLFERRDDFCNGVIAEDEYIDHLEKRVDSDGVSILTRFQPVATDLRQVVSAMKVSASLERIADQAVNIARKARKLNHHAAFSELSLIEPMSCHAIGLFRDGLSAYKNGDLALASSIKDRDRALDALNAGAAAKFLDLMAQNQGRIPDYLNLIFIARHFERVGDYASHIAEDVVYLVAAEDIRHKSASPPA